ncbi:DUF2304 domain-containing protein [Curtobacterium sp. MCBA15_001]|uniref:DUF2304 domain-containing protein n=1 Tax=Curtobacterium sp. MCBA15_001 TaxID=1898731 RepID=UPI0008DEA83D|nr:DUF2304 domain-containing protein [Curtobacterium sp. MCBA15_001]OIH96955.1 hypothetical protein BIU90_15815 [Curtobacterium sp. MCBA15_001]
MNVVTYVFGIVVALLVLGAVIELLRRRRLRERHALWWIVAGIVALVVAVFPGLLVDTASLLGFSVPTNLGFFICLVLLFMVSVSQSAELTVLEEKTRVLAEQSALLEERIERLEHQVAVVRPAAERPVAQPDVTAHVHDADHR